VVLASIVDIYVIPEGNDPFGRVKFGLVKLKVCNTAFHLLREWSEN